MRQAGSCTWCLETDLGQGPVTEFSCIPSSVLIEYW